MQDEDVILWDPNGRPLRWWKWLPGYSRNQMGFVSPEAREKMNEHVGGFTDERPSDAVELEPAEGVWLEVEEEEEEEDE
jgi:hypothetical protein